MDLQTPTPRRRRFSIDDKLKILQETSLPGMTVSYVARRHDISPSLIFQWRRRLADGGKSKARVGNDDSRVHALEARVLYLERVLGKTMLENEMLRDAARTALDSKTNNHGPPRPSPGADSPRGNET
jgi:transposase